METASMKSAHLVAGHGSRGDRPRSKERCCNKPKKNMIRFHA
jgi:hypothetical protein